VEDDAGADIEQKCEENSRESAMISLTLGRVYLGIE
jgi:hypothetical protein